MYNVKRSLVKPYSIVQSKYQANLVEYVMIKLRLSSFDLTWKM